MKLNLSQVRHIMKRLKAVANDTLSQLEDTIREQLVRPKVSPKELKQWLIKLAYDDPKKLVALILKGGEWELVTQRNVERDEGFQQFHDTMAHLREHTSYLLAKQEAALLFEDDWEAGVYPEYLEQELIDSIVDYLNGGNTDVDTEGN